MKSLTMSPFRHAVLMGMALLIAGVGCERPVDQIGRDDDEATEVPAPETTVQVAVIRSEVGVVLDSLRAEVDDLRAGTRDEPLERWTDVSARIEETRGDVLRDVDQVDVADTGEARRVRDRAAERIAELEAEVARTELEFATDRQTLHTRTDERLTELEDNLSEVAIYMSEGDRQPGATPGMAPDRDRAADRDRPAGAAALDQTRVPSARDVDLDMPELRNLQEDLVEAQQLAAQWAPGEDRNLDDIRDELSSQVADLTRDIRKHLYALRWTGHTP